MRVCEIGGTPIKLVKHPSKLSQNYIPVISLPNSADLG